MTGRSKRKSVPLKVKLKALKRLDKGEILEKLAAGYGVGEVTIGDWRRNRDREVSSNKCSGISSFEWKSMKKSEYEKNE
mgnify:CR=1 FL=1